MGVTYRAFDTDLRRPVALKVIAGTLLGDEAARGRFLREARAAAQFRHENVVQIYQLGREGDIWFYAMEFIDGVTLQRRIESGGPLAPGQALALIAQICGALGAAADLGLVHRDLKPANIMLVAGREGGPVAKVIDFGVAKLHDVGDHANTLTQGAFVGTMAYASPEQIEAGEVDGRSDLYSLGCVLWFMLAGAPPFGGGTAAVCVQHLQKEPPWERLAGTPPAVLGLLGRLLAKDPAARPQSAREAAEAVRQCLAQPEGPDRQYKVAGAGRGGMTPIRDGASGHDLAGWRVPAAVADDTPGWARLRSAVGRLNAEPHPNVLRVLSVARVAGSAYILTELPAGIPLIDVVRARRALAPDEAILLLRQVAGAVDHCVKLGTGWPRLDLRDLMVSFAGPADPPPLGAVPVTAWPPFVVRVSPLGMFADAAGPDETIASGSPSAAATQTGEGGLLPPDLGSCCRGMAHLFYELIAGRPAPAFYAPVAPLGEAGNGFLCGALAGGTGFVSAAAFCERLGAVLESRPSIHRGAGARDSPGAGAIPPAPARAGRAIGKYRLAAAAAAALIFLGWLLARGGRMISRETPAGVPPVAAPAPSAATPAPAAIFLRLTTDKTVYREGDLMAAVVEADRDCYLRIYYRGTDGKVFMVFPNKYQQDNRIRGGVEVRVPGPGAQFVLRMGPPFGQETLVAVALENQFGDAGGDGWGEKPLTEYPDADLAEVRARGVGVAGAARGEATTTYEVKPKEE